MKKKTKNYMMMTERIRRILLFLSISLALVACDENEEDLNKDISVPVTVAEITVKSIEKYISTTGTVSPVKEVSLKSEISGNYQLLNNPVTRKKYALGDRVSQGSRVIALKNREFENNLKINSLKLRQEIAKQTYEKQKSLYEKGGVTLSELKNAEIEFVNANYAYQDAQISMQKLSIRAPFTGTVVELPYYTQNTKIEANSSVLKLMDYSQLQMEVKLAEKNFNQIKKNQQVRIMNYTIPDDTLKGFVSQISPAIDPETRSFKVIVKIANPKLKLHPGMFAKGEIIVTSLDSSIVIPKNIVLSKQRGNTVFVINKDLAEERIVNFGIENPEEVQVISGLEVGDRVVIKGFETLRNRSRVKMMK